jgi:hypothetical protein
MEREGSNNRSYMASADEEADNADQLCFKAASIIKS